MYGDFPERRAWFLCFDPVEPAEIVIRESEYRGGNFGPKDILIRRGFGKVLASVFNGRAEPHIRYFGRDQTGKPLDEGNAISWFCVWKKSVRFPVPCKYDECRESYPVLPPRDGILFGR